MTEDTDYSRPGWDSWAIAIAYAVALRADCRRTRVGAVILDAGHRVIATGYNGTAPGRDGCLAGNCPRGRHTYAEIERGTVYDQPGEAYCIATHAEMNALVYAEPLALGDASLYCTIKPCKWCVKVIANTPICRVVYPVNISRPDEFFKMAAYDLQVEMKVDLI